MSQTRRISLDGDNAEAVTPATTPPTLLQQKRDEIDRVCQDAAAAIEKWPAWKQQWCRAHLEQPLTNADDY